MNMYIRIGLIVILLAFFSSSLFAQQQTVHGTVTDIHTGETLPGVNVVVKGTIQGTATDSEGIFKIEVPSLQDTLIFSFVGYQTKEVPINGSTDIYETLTPQAIAGEELVVIGYGSQERSQITGSISSVSSRDINSQQISSLDGHIQGKTAGVQVVQNTGEPGGGMSVNIRGLSSIQAGNEPLYVVDGVPIQSGDASALKRGGSLNALADINPNDIESIEILKDASAASIYGSRATGGVVLITTKRGVEGGPRINFSAYSGVQRIPQYIEVVNARQHRELWIEQKFFNGNQPLRHAMADTLNIMFGASNNTHWQDRLFQKAPMYNADFSVSGGSESIIYSISAGYKDQEGIIKNSGFDRVTSRTNIEYQSDDFSVGTNLSYSRANHDMIRQLGSGNGNWENWTNQPSFQRPTDDQGRTWQREPLINLTDPVQDNTRDRFIGNLYVNYEIINGLELRSNFAIDNMQIRENIFYPSSVYPVGPERRARAYSGRDFGWINENTLTYITSLSEVHNLTGLVGFSQQSDRSEFMIAETSQAASDKIPTVNAGPVLENATSQISEWGMVSYFARMQYNYDSRYFVTGTFRRDGSSKFGKENHYGNFPSFSIGWKISEENMLRDIEFVNNLMLRASYGLTGNQEGIGNFVSRGGYSTGANYLGSGGIRPTAMPNRSLSWESTRQLDIGLDLSLFQNRIQFSADYYNKKTSDLLFSRELPGSTGFSSVLVNVGEIENRGVEFELMTRNLSGGGTGFSWSTNFNISFNQNEILSLPGGEDVFSGNQVLREGESIGTYYGWVFEGVYATDEDVPVGPEPGTRLRNQSTNGNEFQGGDIILKDLNKDGVINSEDRTVIGNEQPDFVGGITNSFSWRNFNLDIFFNFSYGNEKLNVTRRDMEDLGGFWRTTTLYVYENRWQKQGDITDVPINSRIRRSAVGNTRSGTSRFIDDASFLRLQNVNLSYNLPISLTENLSIRNAQIYISGQNLWTLTNWRGGYDPEIGTHLYPIAASVTAGIDINF